MDINNYKEAIYDDLFFIFLFCIKKAKRKLVYQILSQYFRMIDKNGDPSTLK
jgi:hypothetical protein